MMSRGEWLSGRARWVIFFAFLLIVSSTAPVFADSPGDPESSVPSPSVEDDPERYFDARVVPPDLGKVEREEREREEWLASPQAVKERQASWLVYGDLSPAQAEELLRTVFAEQLQTLNDDPARFLSDAQLVRPLDETAAAVEDEGDRSVLDSSVPVRTENDAGDLAKVDLSLTETPLGYETKNAVSDLRLPLAADEKTHVGDDGFAITQAEADDSSARRFGDKNLLYPEVLPDTDLMVAPTSSGVELFNLIRSKESPEELRFDLDLPEGGVLKADGYGGAEVVRDEKTLTHISPPIATDAQGTNVPVELKVEQDAIVLNVPHRSGDYAAPILVDPIIEDWANTGANWYEGKNLAALTNGAWKYEDGEHSGIYENVCCWGGTKTGLMVSFTGNVFFGPNQNGQWSYSTANSKTYIQHAWVTPFWRYDESCTSAQPHDYAGMLWGTDYWNPVVSNKAKQDGTLSLDGNGHAFIIGMGSGPPGVWISCGRHLYAGGVALWIDDDWPPVVHSVTGVPSSEWINEGTPVNLTVNSGDEGLGVRLMTLTHEGKGVIGQDHVGCTGLYGNRCPTDRASQFNFTGLSFGEGVRTTDVTAEDPSGKTGNGWPFQTKVDYSPPEVILDGQLAEASGDDEGAEKGDAKTETLRLPVYNLKVEAKDGSNQSNLTRRSGVKDIEIWLDGVEQSVPWLPQAATEDSRPMTQTYQLELSTLTTSGLHKLEVKVRDQAENAPRVRSIEFEYFPATGIKDEYVMHHFRLFSQQEGEAETEYPGPELAVNVMNGNLVYHEQDVEVEGPTLDLEVERYYNSMLPENEDAEWGDGWTLAQTPDLDPVKTGGSPVPNEGRIRNTSGVIKDKVGLPTEAGTKRFDPVLQVTLEKKTSGGYTLTDETGKSSTSVSFDSTGQTEARLTEGHAKIDYRYEGGDLAEIEVTDPATFAADPEELQIPGPELISAPKYSASFGKNGSGDGQFKYPTDVAIDLQGNLWVTDKSNNRVQKFDPNGKFLAKYGTSGSGNGQFNRPSSVAIDAAGNVLVADSNNHRIQKLSPEGAFVSKFGTSGSGNGQLNKPEEVTVDAAGNIWVADTQNGRVQKFNSAGEFVKVFDSGYLYEPTGVDVDAGGNVWVADWQKNRITVFDSAGNFKSNVGSAGSGNGQFNRLDGLEIDNFGNVWVGDLNNNRIQRFDVAGQYQGQFGTAGSGAGQFGLDFPMGIAADSKGRLWIADPYNDRVQEWLVPIDKPTYNTAFGVNGSSDGQFKHPTDVAVDLQGNLWVTDKSNNRVQKFDPNGKFIAKYGSLGSGNGQFNRPSSVSVDRDGNILIADSNNHRIQKLSPEGTFISKFGTSGSGNGQLNKPEEVTADAKGNIWVADTQNGRVQKFDEKGQFVKVFDSGYLYEPTGVDVDAGGNVWVADWQKNRITVFDSEGGFKSNVGSAGSGNGQFNRLDGLEIDNFGNVWVGDLFNNRIQRFDLAGQYQGQFGTAGSGPGQFGLDFPMGIAADSKGRLWITDPYNDRVQEWLTANYSQPAPPEIDLTDGDPTVEVDTEAGLVTSVSGNAAGTHTYTHDGDFLTSHDGPDGEVLYAKDTAGRLSEVTLPDGTWASVTYFADNRVKSVTLKLAGWVSSKTTTFEYQDGPPQRRTVVDPPDAPVVTYDIAPDGSVLKWWNSAQPPTIDFISGTLWDHKEKDDDLWAGDHLLDVQAFSAEGIASIWVIVNGNELVHETTCEQEPEVAGTECVNPPLKSEWVMNTEQYPPGHLPIEVIVTDHAEGTTAERFWVDVPEPPPPPAPGTPIPPKFAEILNFRNEYGLEKVFPVADEIERNERIFNLINAWYQGDPVARASRDRWGVPLRPEDIAELDYREWFYNVNADRIDQWVEATSPGSYAGYYMDHPAGGVMHIGFIDNQEEELESLKTSLPLEAWERLQVYPTTPTASYLTVRATAQSVLGAIESNSTLANLVVSVEDDEAGKATRVGTPNVAQVEGILDQMLGANAPVTVEYEAGGGALLEGRYRNSGRMRAGDYINGTVYTPGGVAAGYRRCTAGFGAQDRTFKPNDEEVLRLFLLTAGHCYNKIDTEVWRAPQDESQDFDDAGKSEVGRLARNALEYAELSNVRTDGAAIRIKQGGIVPLAIWGWDGHALPTEPAGRARKGNTVCYSGAISKTVACGQIVARSLDWADTDEPYDLAGYWVRFPEDKRPQQGDSGSPVWNLHTDASIGLVSAGRPPDSLTETLVAPLLHPPNMPSNRVPGILHHMGMEPLQLKLGG